LTLAAIRETLRAMLKKLFVVTLVLGALVAAAAWVYLQDRFAAPGPLTEEKLVLIAPGTGFRAIARQLESEGVIADDRLFLVAAMLTGDAQKAQAGEYRFPAATTGQEVLQKLIGGDVVVRALTIPEGWTVAQVRAALLAEETLTGEVPTEIAEGSLLPETLHFMRGESRMAVVKRMQAAMDAALETLWETRAENLPIHTRAEVLTLASIVERETGVPSERPLIAAVYLNRLRIGMRLQADPTVQYGLELQRGGPLGRALTRADLATDHPYNTYTRTGLPPGPIANPGRASIAAVLNPVESQALYFVATGNGGHFFARTLKEHNANVARYRRALATPAMVPAASN
jgi:UPF0755 protein